MGLVWTRDTTSNSLGRDFSSVFACNSSIWGSQRKQLLTSVTASPLTEPQQALAQAEGVIDSGHLPAAVSCWSLRKLNLRLVKPAALHMKEVIKVSVRHTSL